MRNSAKKRVKIMLSFDRLCNQSKKFSRLTGVKLEEFREIVRKVRPKWNAFQQKKKVAGRNRNSDSEADEEAAKILLWQEETSHDEVRSHNQRKWKNLKHFKGL